MALVSRMIFEVVRWRARRGLAIEAESFADSKKEATLAYWLLARVRVCFCGAPVVRLHKTVLPEDVRSPPPGRTKP
jgi:hypothetical protein